ncbi:M23 family metallopeptidase [Nonomuraea deserti]|uniref:M23 family metallopeptidase n=1 Tax=Nonomuraea deserti TaxID=1848322 RepID=UPI0014048362|nr:M23 family metallopeptidase [Nonomuraea deserti]
MTIGIASGAAEAASKTSAGPRPDFRAPWPCKQIRDYFHHSSEVSNAIDFNVAGSADLGTPALASAAGTVVSARSNGGYGNEVVVDHGGGWRTRVAHLNTFSVAAGQAVARGQELGKVGSTGNSSGPHLHYEQIADGVRVPIVVDGAAMRYDGQTYRHTSNNCGTISNLAVYRSSEAMFYIRHLDGSGAPRQVRFGQRDDLPAVGHYEDSNFDNLAVYRQSDSAFHIRKANGDPWRIPFGDGTKGDLPAPGRFENSNYDNLAVFRPSNGTFYIRSADGSTLPVPFPNAREGDVPAIGHYENSSYDNLAIYRRSEGAYYIRWASGKVDKIQFGNPGDLPAPGYFQAGRYTNLAVYRPSTSTFHIRMADLSITRIVFGDGSKGDRPAIGKFE